MREAVVEAKVGVAALREALGETRHRLEDERRELETVRRRGRLAGGVGDAETVRVAERFESRHAERVSVLAGTLAAQERELELAEREVAEMTAELQRTLRGTQGGARAEGDAVPATGASAPPGSGERPGGEGGNAAPAGATVASSAFADAAAGDASAGDASAGSTSAGGTSRGSASAESLRREVERVAREAEAERQLLELKRRMRR